MLRSYTHAPRTVARATGGQGGRPTDVDGFIERNQASWQRLDRLVRDAGRNARHLDGERLDELVRLHLRVSSHLSTARTHLRDPSLIAHLSGLVARSSSVVHGTRPRTWATVVQGVTRTFPAAVWHARLPILVSSAVFIVTFVVVAFFFATTPAALDIALPGDVRESYLEHDFEAYYSSEPGTTFAARLFTNNAAVGFLAFGVGILWMLPTLYVLALNAANVGLAAGLFHAAGDAGRFWGLILPHGMLEITAVLIAGGAGIRLGWATISPGDRRRSVALAEEGRRAVVIALGLVLAFFVAALIEAFVTPAPWPTWARVGTGAMVWAAFCIWLVVAGRAAAARGLTGALGEQPTSVDAAAPPLPARDPAVDERDDQSPPRALTSR